MVQNIDLLRSMSQGPLDRELAKWNQLDTLVRTDHPLFQEYEHLRNAAMTIITQRMPMTFGMTQGSQGFDIYEKEAEKLAELYGKAENIRSRMASDAMRTEFNIPQNSTFDTVMEAEIDAAVKDLGAQGDAIRDRLLPIAIGLGKDAAEVRDGDTEGNFFYFPSGPAAGMINFDKIAEAEKVIREMQSTAGVVPKLGALADKLMKGLERMKTVDPIRANDRANWDALMAAKGKMDLKPLRALGALVGGLITAAGLGANVWQIFKGETPNISAAQLGWAGATLLMVNPKLLQNASSRTVDQITELGRPDVRRVIAGGFKGDTGKTALDELQELRNNDLALLNKLAREPRLNNAQIAALADDPGSKLVTVLSGMDETLRPVALRVLGKRMDEGEIDLIKALMA